MSALGWAIGGWLFLNLVIVVALLQRRSRPLAREKLFWWVVGEQRFQSPEHRNVARRETPHRHFGIPAHLPQAAPVRVARRTSRGRKGVSMRVLTALAVIAVLVAGSAMFVSTHPRSIAACAYACE
jgi:hypothetical protein